MLMHRAGKTYAEIDSVINKTQAAPERVIRSSP